VTSSGPLSRIYGRVTFWGFTDKRSWIPEVFAGWGSAHLYDEAYQPKPAYFAVLEALMN
jgi:endo-1,4-beta-xylanase